MPCLKCISPQLVNKSELEASKLYLRASKNLFGKPGGTYRICRREDERIFPEQEGVEWSDVSWQACVRVCPLFPVKEKQLTTQEIFLLCLLCRRVL